jgi:light-regulated signal transduction histidine kinase (bacteriophytochrome)
VHWRADGTSFPIEYWSRPIVRDGQIIGTVVSFVDITERKVSEAELTQHRERLEELVRLRTAELETVNRELEAFSYSVSHDLRAPLRAIDGFARALNEDYADRFDAVAHDYLDRVRKAAQRMGTLIDDLLQLSRVNRGALRPAEVDLSAMAHEIVGQLAGAESKRQVSVEISPQLRAQGDTRLLHIVLTNLLDNAWKYTSKTDPARIVFGQDQVNGKTVFFVRDNGAGFDMQYVAKLFGAFQRLHGAEFPGTGIGLATAQRILARHGGRIWAEAQPGQGATFYFTLTP